MSHIITASLLRWHATCTRHIWLQSHGDPAKQSELGTGVTYSLEQGQQHEAQVHEVTTRGIRTIPVANWQESVGATRELIQAGASIIIGASLETLFEFPDHSEPLVIRGKIDRLQRLKQQNSNRHDSVIYIPIEIKRYDKISLADALQLDLYIWLLRQHQRVRIDYGEFWLSADLLHRPLKRIPHGYNEDRLMNHLYNVARLIQKNTSAPSINIRLHCNRCHWKQTCIEEAKQQQNITLLNARPETIEDMYNANIRTLAGVAQTDTQTILTFRQVGKTTASKLKAQAQAYVQNRPIVMQTPPAITREMGWYFDIETNPDTNDVWSIGWRWQTHESQVILVLPECQSDVLTLPGGCTIQTVPDSNQAWEFFAEQVADNTQPIFHWSKADSSILRKHGPQWVYDVLQGRLHDLHQSFSKSIQLPTRSNSLKIVASFAGFHWRTHQDWRIAWEAYNDFLQTGQESHLTDVCQYQTDDVDAMVAIQQWMLGLVE